VSPALAAAGTAVGQIYDPGALRADAAGNLYVAGGGKVQRRDAQVVWSVIATYGAALGQVDTP
jgi:hypothetical protein